MRSAVQRASDALSEELGRRYREGESCTSRTSSPARTRHPPPAPAPPLTGRCLTGAPQGPPLAFASALLAQCYSWVDNEQRRPGSPGTAERAGAVARSVAGSAWPARSGARSSAPATRSSDLGRLPARAAAAGPDVAAPAGRGRPGSATPTSARSSAACAGPPRRSSSRSPRACASRPRRCTSAPACSTRSAAATCPRRSPPTPTSTSARSACCLDVYASSSAAAAVRPVPDPHDTTPTPGGTMTTTTRKAGARTAPTRAPAGSSSTPPPPAPTPPSAPPTSSSAVCARPAPVPQT